jgi:hypothetical protein
MTQDAGFGRAIDVMMQEHAGRHAEQQHDERQRNYYTPELLLVRHS